MQQATYHDLNGASVFITGGGGGIGAALTEGFVAQGAKVAFVGRSDYTAFAASLGEAHGNPPLFIQCDVTDTTALQAAMDSATAAHGPITVLVNNAANDLRMPADTVTEPMWQEMIDVNFKHYFFACQKAAETMRKTGGSIINYTSTSYMIGSNGMSPYVSCNAGIMGMTRALAREWGPDNIRVNAIAPGWVLTQKQIDMWVTEEKLANHLANQCIPEKMQPEDMVGGTLFLASAGSRLMTGQVMTIDAGVVFTG